MADSNELIEILKRLELNQEQLAIGQRILSEQLEVLQEDRHANAEQFRIKAIQELSEIVDSLRGEA